MSAHSKNLINADIAYSEFWELHAERSAWLKANKGRVHRSPWAAGMARHYDMCLRSAALKMREARLALQTSYGVFHPGAAL